MRYEHLVALLYTIVLFLDRLDLTIVNIILPTLAQTWHVSIEETNNVNLAFLLALAVSIPVSGWLGNRFGLKRVFLLAVLLFGGGASLCAMAPSLFVLIGCRFLQGIGGGLLMPVGMTLLYRIYDKSQYASITSFTFIPSLIAPAIAPLLGGILSDTFGWRAVFCFSGPICLGVALTALLLLREEETSREVPFDWRGFVSSALFLLSFFASLSRLSAKGFTVESVSGLFFSMGCLYAFIRFERQASHPLISLDLFRHALFMRVNSIQICFQMCHFGSIFLVGMYLQLGLGLSASRAGFIMGMQAIGAMLVTRISVRLFHHYSPKLPIALGLGGVGLITPCILFIQPAHELHWGALLFFVRGLFSGLCGAPIQTLGVIGFSAKMLGQATSVFNMSRQVAISLGVVVSSLLLSWGFYLTNVREPITPPLASPVASFVWSFCGISLIAGLGLLWVRRLSYGSPPKLSPAKEAAASQHF